MKLSSKKIYKNIQEILNSSDPEDVEYPAKDLVVIVAGKMKIVFLF